MHRGDHVVAAVEHRLRVVDPSAGEDVGLDPFQHPEVGIRRVDRVDLVVLARERLDGEAAGVERGLRMVRDAEVPPAAGARGGGELGDRRAPIGILRVTVQGAAQVALGDERGEGGQQIGPIGGGVGMHDVNGAHKGWERPEVEHRRDQRAQILDPL